MKPSVCYVHKDGVKQILQERGFITIENMQSILDSEVCSQFEDKLNAINDVGKDANLTVACVVLKLEMLSHKASLRNFPLTVELSFEVSDQNMYLTLSYRVYDKFGSLVALASSTLQFIDCERKFQPVPAKLKDVLRKY